MKGTSSPTSTASAPSTSPPPPTRPQDSPSSPPGPTPSAGASPPSDLQPFDFQPLGRVVSGPGTLARLGELTRGLGVTRVLLVTDPGLAVVGHPRRAAASLAEAGLLVFTFDGVQENPTEHHVARGVAFARSHGVDGIVAVGGGSAMDCAKGVNFILTNGGRMADYKGHGKATKPMLASVGVPTTSGTGSEAQSYALITDESSHMKMACGDKKAAFRVAILDPELTLSQPRTVTAVTGIDAVAHALESFVCTRRNAISSASAAAAWWHLAPHFETVLASPGDLAARSAMQVGAHLAGMAIENAMLGACHSCANPLTAHYGLTHGVAIGVLLPHVVRYNAAAVGHLYAELMPGVESPGEALARRVTALVEAAGLPARLRDCGVSESILPLLAEEANQQWTARFNPRPVTDADLLSIYQAAY